MTYISRAGALLVLALALTASGAAHAQGRHGGSHGHHYGSRHYGYSQYGRPYNHPYGHHYRGSYYQGKRYYYHYHGRSGRYYRHAYPRHSAPRDNGSPANEEFNDDSPEE